MMMKLMKFLVVALIAGGVFTSATVVAYAASNPAGNAVLCDYSTGGNDWWTKERKSVGEHLEIFEFRREENFNRAYRYNVSLNPPDSPDKPTVVGGRITLYEYNNDYISWFYALRGDYNLNRATLKISGATISLGNANKEMQCELFNPAEIENFFKPWVKKYNAALERELMEMIEEERQKAREAKKRNKI